MKRKFIFAFVLALILCLCLVPSAFAEDADEYKVAHTTVGVTPQDGTEEQIEIEDESIQKVIEQSKVDAEVGGGTVTTAATEITLYENYGNVYQSIDIKENYNVTLNLNGNTLISSGVTINVVKGGTLTLKNGTVSSDGGTTILCNGTLNLIGVTVKTTSGTAIESSGEKAVVNVESGTSVEMAWNSIYATNGGTININDGTIGEHVSIYASTNSTEDCGGTVNISGGIIKYHIRANYGTVNISGGTFIGNGTYSVNAVNGTVNISGGIFDGYNVETEKGTVNVKNGFIRGTIKAGVEQVSEGSETGTVNISGGTVEKILIQKNAIVNISGGTTYKITIADNYEVANTHPPIHQMQPDDYSLEISGGYFYKDTVELVKSNIVKDRTLSALVNDYYQVIDPSANKASKDTGDTDSVISLPKIIARLLNSDNGYSVVSKDAMSIELKYTDSSKTNQTPEAVSVIINGVEVEFTIAEDGTVVIAPEVLAALAPGSYVVTIATTEGVASLTIVITE